MGEACPTPLHTLLSLQGRLVLSNKMARTIGFFYTLFLHCLVFLVGAEAVVRAAFIMLPSPPGQKGPRPSPSPTICSWPLLSPSRASAQPGDDKPTHWALKERPGGSIRGPVLDGLGEGKGCRGSLRKAGKRVLLTLLRVNQVGCPQKGHPVSGTAHTEAL